MIQFRSKENRVLVTVDTGVPTAARFYEPTIQMGDEVQAYVMAEHLNKKLEDAIVKAKKEYYNLGWADAKAKRKKQDQIWNVRI